MCTADGAGEVLNYGSRTLTLLAGHANSWTIWSWMLMAVSLSQYLHCTGKR